MKQRRLTELLDHDFSGHNLTDRYLSDHNIRGGLFSAADLRGVLFFESILQNADFATAKNLNLAQFGGADLSGASFPDDFEFPGLEHAGNITQNTKTVFFLMLVGNVIAWLTVANVTDGALIGNATRSALPIIESEISIARFFLFAPILLLLVHAYFVVHLQRVWEEVSLLPAIFPDGQSVVRRLPSWLPVGLVRIYCERLNGRNPPLIFLQIAAVTVAVWLVQPFTMVLFGARYLITRDFAGLSILVVLFFLTAMLSTCSFILTKRTLQGNFRHLVRQSSDENDDASRNRVDIHKIYGKALIIAAIPSLIFVIGTWDYQDYNGFTRRLENSRFMQLLGFRYTALIRDTNLSDSQLDLSGRDLFEARFLDSEFSNGDFSGADLSGAYIMRSRFDDVRFDGTIFNEVYVNGASFRSTSFDLRKVEKGENRYGNNPGYGFSGELMYSCLNRSSWKGKVKTAVFFENYFQDAVFQQVNMTNVFFTSSDLQRASFRKSKFDTVYFTKSKLQNALFESVNSGNGNKQAITIFDSILERAYFRDVKARVVIRQSDAREANFEGDISGLRFENSDLRGANFRKAKNIDAVSFIERDVKARVVIRQSDAREANFEGDISGLQFENSDLRGANFKKATNIDAVSFIEVCIDGKTKFPDGYKRPKSKCQSGETSSQKTAQKLKIGDPCDPTWVKRNVVGDLQHGSIVDKEECRDCHNSNIGPPLGNIGNWISGNNPDFKDRYSKSIRGMSIPWGWDTLDLYLRSPDRLVPGNRMRILGIRDPGVRKKILVELFSE